MTMKGKLAIHKQESAKEPGWVVRYDNEADYKTMLAQAKAEGYKFYFWASDDCYGYEGNYNGGSFVFMTSIDAIDDESVRNDAMCWAMPL